MMSSLGIDSQKNDLITAEDRTRFTDIIEEWTLYQPDKPVSENDEISWRVEREALMDITDYILENFEIVDQELKYLDPVYHIVTFGVSELLDTLHPPPTVPKKFQNPNSNPNDGGNSVSPRPKESGKLKNVLKPKKKDRKDKND